MENPKYFGVQVVLELKESESVAINSCKKLMKPFNTFPGLVRLLGRANNSLLLIYPIDDPLLCLWNNLLNHYRFHLKAAEANSDYPDSSLRIIECREDDDQLNNYQKNLNITSA